MFGIFGGNLGKVRRLRTDFEKIRQKVLFQMIPYEQYSFGSVFHNLPDEITDAMENIDGRDFEGWRKFGKNLLSIASTGYKQYSRAGGISGEGGRAGTQGVLLLAFESLAKSYDLPEAVVLSGDIKRFRLAVEAYVTSDDYDHQPLPKSI